MEIAQTANEKRPDKERKRKETAEEQNRVDEFYATPVGEKKAIFDTKMEAFIPEEVDAMEIAKPKKGRPSKK